MHDHDHQLTADRSAANAALAPPRAVRPMTTGLPRPASPTARTVIECYDFLDRFLPECGIWDLTDGLYHGDPRTPHEQAQQEQVEWLLDQVHCQRGTRLLEIGCGNGRLLRAAGARGAEALGGNVSRLQVEHCRANGLDARLMDYREIDESWNGRFDAVILNGCIEHFVQAEDVQAGLADAADGHHDDPSQRAHPQACSGRGDERAVRVPSVLRQVSLRHGDAVLRRIVSPSRPVRALCVAVFPAAW